MTWVERQIEVVLDGVGLVLFVSLLPVWGPLWIIGKARNMACNALYRRRHGVKP